jgi:2',3'-cyclic-nucleotide 2'-phosphodiesterase/3'-nucleotidase
MGEHAVYRVPRAGIRRWSWLGVCLVCLGGQPASYGRDIRITILCTTDVHGHILPGRDYNGNKNVGGLLRCASAIEAVRSEETNVICVDGGDLVQGAPESGVTKGILAVRALNWLRYDAWALGNHDFDWGLDALSKLHNETRVPMLAANLSGEGVQRMLPRLQPWLVKDVDGVRIAFVALTTPGTPAWLPPDARAGIEFERSASALRRVLPAVRHARPDVWVLLAHQGLPEFQDDHANEILQIAREFPEWDVIFGAHTHKIVPGTRIGRSLYVQAGYFGNWLARVDLTFDNVTRKITELSSRAVEIGTNWPEHAGLRQYLGSDLRKTEALLGRELGVCERALTAKDSAAGLSDMQELIARAIAWKTGADAVLVGRYGEEGLEAGPLTVADLWRAIPYENTVGLISLTPAELRSVMEEVACWARTEHRLTLWGLYFDDGEASGGSARAAPVLRWPNGAPVHGRQRLRIAVSSYALASGGRRYTALAALVRRPETRLEMTGIDTRSAVIEYVQKRKRIGADAGPLQLSDGTCAKNMPNERREP